MGLVWTSERFFLLRCPPYLSAEFEDAFAIFVDFNIDLLLLSVLKLVAALLGSYCPLFLWFWGVITAFCSKDWDAAVVAQWSRSRSCRRVCGTLLVRLLFDVMSTFLVGASRVWSMKPSAILMGWYCIYAGLRRSIWLVFLRIYVFLKFAVEVGPTKLLCLGMAIVEFKSTEKSTVLYCDFH